MRIKALVTVVAVPFLYVAPAQASTTLSLLDGVVNSAPLTSVSSSGSTTITLDADGGNGVFVSGQAVSQVGLNRLYVANSTSLPFANSATKISGLSFWADNLSVSSANVGPVHVSAAFSFNGSYVGPFSESENPSSTFGNAYFLTAPGRFLDIRQGAEDGGTTIETSLGSAALQGQFTQVPGGLLSAASLCGDDDAEGGCDPFSTTRSFTLDFDVNPGDDFWMAGYFFVGDLAQGEMVDAFHTARLTGITLDDGASLLSESGQIRLLGDGSYGIQGVQGAVPEPATWAMMIFGFGLAGAAMRRGRDERRNVAFG